MVHINAAISGTHGAAIDITNESIGNAKEIYLNMKSISRNKSWDYLLCFEPINGMSSSKIMPEINDAAQFLIETFDLWIQEDDPDVKIRIFMDIIRGMVGKSPKDCSFRNDCGHFLGISYSGNVYPCGRFIGNEDLLLGNIMNPGGLERIISSSFYKDTIHSMNSLPEKCIQCKHRSVCGGGCAYVRYETGKKNFNKDYYWCEVKYRLIEHIEQVMEPFLKSS